MAWELIVDKKANQTYEGKAEKCSYRFSLWPEQIPGVSWTAQQIANAHADKLAEEGSKLLELRVWEDTEPTWTTDYYVEVVATASPLFWNAIIIGVLVLLIGIAIYFSIDKVEEIAEYVGEKAPITIPLMAIAGIGILTLIGISMVRRTT